jgi:hypothetical protein
VDERSILIVCAVAASVAILGLATYQAFKPRASPAAKAELMAAPLQAQARPSDPGYEFMMLLHHEGLRRAGNILIDVSASEKARETMGQMARGLAASPQHQPGTTTTTTTTAPPNG